MSWSEKVDEILEPLKVDRKQSLFWIGKDFNLFILKLDKKDAFAVSIVRGEGVQTALFTGNEFSSLVNEMVKYCLDLPVEARAIPCPITCTDVPHGCLETMKSDIQKNGKMIVSFDERWLKYHGDPDEVVFKWDTEAGKAWIEPVESPALRKKRICPYCGITLSGGV